MLEPFSMKNDTIGGSSLSIIVNICSLLAAMSSTIAFASSPAFASLAVSSPLPSYPTLAIKTFTI